MSEELTLLPCYKCGGTATYHHTDKYPKGLEPIIVNGETIKEGHVWHFVNCEKCREQRSGLYPINSKEAIAEWNSIPRALTWTNEPPKVPGWYWFKGEYGIRIAWIKHDSRKMNELYAVIGGVGNWMSTLHGQWAGPIPEPREPK
ncbi:hypothetical protein [Bilophila wadsworthia]|jgi:hypothetical protein|uniref:hypothetical protein n=1 Tax=Bilophila wadsworthia TaxID=35833 RepID=UPI0027BAA275|nr:hypothetical protein [Bilophila wadsworthia]